MEKKKELVVKQKEGLISLFFTTHNCTTLLYKDFACFGDSSDISLEFSKLVGGIGTNKRIKEKNTKVNNKKEAINKEDDEFNFTLGNKPYQKIVPPIIQGKKHTYLYVTRDKVKLVACINSNMNVVYLLEYMFSIINFMEVLIKDVYKIKDHDFIFRKKYIYELSFEIYEILTHTMDNGIAEDFEFYKKLLFNQEEGDVKEEFLKKKIIKKVENKHLIRDTSMSFDVNRVNIFVVEYISMDISEKQNVKNLTIQGLYYLI